MPTLTIDNRPVTVDAGATVLEAARRLGITIPTLCYRGGCAPETSCMVCVVRINGARRLVPSCATIAIEGMAVESETAEVRGARRLALELLLGDHLGDCVGPCRSVCPAHMDIPRMIRQIVAGEMAQAVATVRERIPLPAILGRICPELCEKGCRRGQLDSPVAIRLLKRHVGDWALAHAEACRMSDAAPSGRSVAIVGAGPAGLAAAFYLAGAGHACVLYDDHATPGGRLLHDGVSEATLPRDVAEAEIGHVLRIGVEFCPETLVGVHVSLEELRARYDAVLIATGAMEAGRAAKLGLRMRQRGIAADRHTQMTELPGVFVAGAALSPSRHAVWSVGSGYGAAQAISRYLAGGAVSAEHRPYTVARGRLDDGELQAFAAGFPRGPRVKPADGETAGFATPEALAEAERCLRCDCAGIAQCGLREWAMAYGAHASRHKQDRRAYRRETSHPEVTYEPGKCINCGLCVQIAGRHRDRLGLAFIGRGFTVGVGVPFDETFAEGLGDVAGECALACPTGALVSWSKPQQTKERASHTTAGPS